MEIKKIGLIGLGAIGSSLAVSFHTYFKDQFYIIAGGSRKERLAKGVSINNQVYQFNFIEPQNDEPLDLIMICTKFNHLPSVIEDIKNHVSDHTKIISFLNGVTSEDILIDAFGKDKVIYSFTRISAVNIDHQIVYKNSGTYYFGHPKNTIMQDDIKAIDQLFTDAHIHHEIPEDMLAHQWFKYYCNVSENQVSAVLDIPFGAWKVSDNADHLRMMAGHEVYLIAKAKGIDIKQEWIDQQRALLSRIPYDNVCSMVQDLRQKRHSEVDMFSKEVMKMGKEFNIPTPVNETLYHMIKVLEAKNDGDI